MDEARDVLDYWFGAPGSPEYGTVRPHWFHGGPDVDRAIRDRFLDHHRRAAAGALDAWRNEARRCLALTVTLDQFPRNMFRGRPESFAADAKAREVARHSLARGYDRAFLPVERIFVYLPFEHSEDLADQRLAVELFEAIGDHPEGPKWVEHAVAHLRIVERFGRFPHRNAILGRQSTAAELEFLAANDERFGTDGKPRPDATAP
jgi:uncharacterized protein (DUF924 family)